MQVVKKVAVLIGVVWLALIIVMPKQDLYYKLEHALAEKDIKISSEDMSEGWFSFSLEKATVYMNGVKIATIEEITFFTLLFYTHSSIEDIKFDSSFKKYVPAQIDEVGLSHWLFSPYFVSLQAQGAFGEANGAMDLSEKSIKIKVSEVEKLGLLKSEFKKVEEGWQYETSF